MWTKKSFQWRSKQERKKPSDSAFLWYKWKKIFLGFVNFGKNRWKEKMNSHNFIRTKGQHFIKIGLSFEYWEIWCQKKRKSRGINNIWYRRAFLCMEFQKVFFVFGKAFFCAPTASFYFGWIWLCVNYI